MSILPERVRHALIKHGRLLLAGAGCTLGLCLAASPAMADGWGHGEGHRGTPLIPGKLLLATSEYATPNIQAGVTQLPPKCTKVTPTDCATAVADGTYPFSFNNDTVDSFFGITSPVYLDELTPSGQRIGTIPVPANEFVTSFSSKSELALNLSPEGKYLSFVGYGSTPGQIDVSNANTPGIIDPGNGDLGPYYRVVAQLDRDGHWTFTETNAYSGDNGRAAITNDENGQDLLYTAGNAGQSSSPPANVVSSTGAQIMTPSSLPEADQNPGAPTPLGSFNITQLGDKGDKATKDNNYRGIAVHNNVVYYTKGSGGNGVDTVYYVDTVGGTCPNGVGLPAAGAQLPTSAPGLTPTTSKSYKGFGLQPTNMCILKGFPTNLVPAANTYPSTQKFPFGIWFANDHTLYVADEGSGDNPYANGQYTDATASNQPDAGLEKWVFDSTTQQWNLAYTLQSGLDLGQPYTVPGYPTGTNPLSNPPNLPWAPATDGLRQLTGRVNPDGTATVWATTSTVSGGGDQGADPNKLVEVTDRLGSTDPATASREWFRTVKTAHAGEVLRGVSFTPGTSTRPGWGWGDQNR